jgi:UDP-glucose 6-dehydrogenase
MRMCAHGLSHLGAVTHAIIGRDDNSSVVSALERCEPPLYGPGLADLIRAGATAAPLTQVSA